MAWLRHEVANAVGAAAGWLEVARQDGARAPQALHRATQALRAATEWLQAGAARGEAARRLRVDEVLQEAVGSLQVEAERRNVGLRVAATTNAYVEAAPSHLRSVVWNLLRNAIEASRRGGLVRVEAFVRGARVVIVVHDNGVGRNDEEARRAFQAGFSTKEHDRGVGLAVVRAAVDAMGGLLRVDSSPGMGTQVRIELPRLDRSAAASPSPDEPREPATSLPSAAAPSPASPSRQPLPTGLSVLLVEDDDDLRELAAMVLRRAGARVEAVATVLSALNHPAPIDVLVTDEHLPDGSGQALWSQLGRAERARGAVLVSGSPDVLGGAPGTVVLRKPYTPSELLAAVRAAATPARSATG